MTRRQMTQILSVEQVQQSPIEGGLVAHWERAMVGQLARFTHEAGEQFTSWPTTHRLPRRMRDGQWVQPDLGRGATHIVIEVTVETETRP